MAGFTTNSGNCGGGNTDLNAAVNTLAGVRGRGRATPT